MSVDELGNEADKLWKSWFQAIRAGDLDERLASEMLKSAEATLDTQWLRMFGVLLIHGLVDVNEFEAAEALSRQILADSRSEAERIIAAGRNAFARAREDSRRAAAMQALMDLGNVSGAGLDEHLVAFRRARERDGDIVTDEEVSALRVRFPMTAAARGGKVPSAADLYSALKDIRRGAGDSGA
jgi:hypothetical protein